MTETTKVQKNNIDIEATAKELFALKQKGLWDYEKEGALFNACLDQPKMPRPDFQKLDKLMDEEDRLIAQRLDAYVDAWAAAWKSFLGTGSFMALLRSCYFKKAKGCEAAYLEEKTGKLNQKLKLRAIKRVLKAMAKKRGIKLELSKTNINFLNLDNLEAFVKEKGLIDNSDPITAAREMAKLHSYVINDCVVCDEIVGEGEEGESFHLSDAVSVAAFRGQAVQQDQYSFGEEFEQEEHSPVEKALRKFGETKKGDVLKMLLTYGAFCLQGDTELMAHELDEDFYAFLCANQGFDNATDAITTYTGKQRETVRKDVLAVYKVLCPNAPVAKASA